MGEEKKGVPRRGAGVGIGKVKVQPGNFRDQGRFFFFSFPQSSAANFSKGLGTEKSRGASSRLTWALNTLASCFLNVSFKPSSELSGAAWSCDAPVPSTSPSQMASDAPASRGNNFNSGRPSAPAGAGGGGGQSGQRAVRRPERRGVVPRCPPHYFPPGPDPEGGGAGEQEATSPRRGSRPRAASPSARASSGCSPPQTPARLWLTAPCGAAGDGPGAGPGRAGGGAAGPRLLRAMLGAAGTPSGSAGRARARAHTP